MFLSPCSVYDRDTIAEIVDRIVEKSGYLTSLRGATVLLKPNLISGRGSGLSCSHPDYIAGVALWFKEQGATVKVGDSPAFGSATSVCRSRGITPLLDALGIKIIEFSTPVKKILACGRTLTLAGEVFDCDYFVGLPRVKAHKQMYVTLAVKNIFGIVVGVHKAKLHMTCGNNHGIFSDTLLSLVDVLPPQFHFIDGIEVMSKSGPLDGEPLSLGCIGASASPVALDAAILDILEIHPQNSPLYLAAMRQNMPEIKSSIIGYPLSQPSQFYGSGFIAPDALTAIRFNPFRFISGMCKRMALQRRS